MRKLLLLLLTTLLLFPYALTAQHLPWKGAPYKLPTTNVKGDVNGDGSINITDVTLMVAHILGQQSNDFIADNADVNNDGDITITDVTETVSYILEGYPGTSGGIGDITQAYLACPDDNHPHMIDLGLPSGTLWACCNVGATTPEGYGGYYAWGETEEKSDYSWETYIHCDGTMETCHDIGSIITGSQYDVAHVKWGDIWQMPSQEEFEELYRKCSFEWTSINGINGAKFTGSNGGNIFLPAHGIYTFTNTLDEGQGGYYWSGTSINEKKEAYGLIFSKEHPIMWSGSYRLGSSVRPVISNSLVLPVTLSSSTLNLLVGNDKTVEIISGSGHYSVQSNDESIVTATLQGNTIIVTAVNAGNATITVTDTSSGQTATIEVTVNVPVYICPDNNHPHMIDLGLPSGTKWACCNVGATTPEGYGGYYAWGETEEKSEYSWENYIHCDGSIGTCHDLGTYIAGTQYDVAHVKWGGKWQMPSPEHIMELLDNCSFTWTSSNGVNGAYFTGPSGYAIFIPASGSYYLPNLSGVGI